jgi:enoyl-CoA hydratase
LTEFVTVERDGHVLLIGVNRPAKRNAFNLAVIDALGRAYEILGTDERLRAGVLFAHGDHFSAGLDLAEVGPAVAGHGPQVLPGDSGSIGIYPGSVRSVTATCGSGRYQGQARNIS